MFWLWFYILFCLFLLILLIYLIINYIKTSKAIYPDYSKSKQKELRNEPFSLKNNKTSESFDFDDFFKK